MSGRFEISAALGEEFCIPSLIFSALDEADGNLIEVAIDIALIDEAYLFSARASAIEPQPILAIQFVEITNPFC
jgi:hypothetical protein